MIRRIKSTVQYRRAGGADFDPMKILLEKTNKSEGMSMEEGENLSKKIDELLKTQRKFESEELYDHQIEQVEEEEFDVESELKDLQQQGEQDKDIFEGLPNLDSISKEAEDYGEGLDLKDLGGLDEVDEEIERQYDGKSFADLQKQLSSLEQEMNIDENEDLDHEDFSFEGGDEEMQKIMDNMFKSMSKADSGDIPIDEFMKRGTDIFSNSNEELERLDKLQHEFEQGGGIDLEQAADTEQEMIKKLESLTKSNKGDLENLVTDPKDMELLREMEKTFGPIE